MCVGSVRKWKRKDARVFDECEDALHHFPIQMFNEPTMIRMLLCRQLAAATHRSSPWSSPYCTVHMYSLIFDRPSSLNRPTVKYNNNNKFNVSATCRLSDHGDTSKKKRVKIVATSQVHVSAHKMSSTLWPTHIQRTWSRKSNNWLMSYVIVGVFGLRRFRCSS